MIMGARAGHILAQAAPAEGRLGSQTGHLSSEISPGDQHDTPRAARGGRPRQKDRPKLRLFADLLIRGLGLLGIGLSAGACLWLYRLLHAGTPPAPSLGQYALATITFLGASIGSGLLVLGGHIHDRIEIAERYRRRW